MPTASRSPANQAFRQSVLNYDPTFTDARYTTVQDFKTKGESNNLKALSTGLEHVERAFINSAKLGTSPSLFTGKTLSGDAAAYEQDIKLFTQEAGKLVKGGVMGQEEYHDLKKQLESPVQSIRDKGLKETVNLLGGRVKSTFQHYRAGVGKDIPVETYFDQNTQDRLKRYAITGDQSAGGPKASTQGAAKAIPTGKFPAFKGDNVVGYADDKKGTNYHAF